MAMLERQRHQYLSVLGIDQYVPKRILAGAKPSLLLADELLLTAGETVTVLERGSVDTLSSANEENSTRYSDPTVATRSSFGTHETTSVSALGNSVPEYLTPDNSAPDHSTLDNPTPLQVATAIVQAEPETKTPITHEPKLNQQQKNSAQTIQFVLSIWRIADSCLVLDTRQPGTALPTDRLLQNILRAIGYPLVQLPSSELIRWPLFDKDQHAQDEEQARAMVQAFIHAQHTKSPLRRLILMGEEAVLFGLNRDQVQDQAAESLQASMLTHPEWNAQIALTPSLLDMLQEPMLKANAWQVLRQFDPLDQD